MNTNVLSYLLDEQEVKVTVQRATARVGINRYLLASKAQEDNKSEPDEALKILRLILYPDIMSTTIAAEGIPWPMTFEQFIELPEEFVNEWAEATYKVNPHWRPKEVPDDPKNEKRSRRKL